MKHSKSIAAAVVLGGMLTTAPAFAAFEGLSMMRMGAWEVDFSGNVNAFVTSIKCDPDVEGDAVYGGLACGSDGIDSDHHNVQTGLLPSWFNMSAATVTDRGVRTGIHISFQPGADSNVTRGGNDGALGLNSSNFRQVFLTFGTESMGTFKIGRDLGVFASDAILNDMTLLGVGTVGDGSAKGGNTTLGRIGVGYLYADWKSQLQYTSPNMGGLTFTAALVDTWGTEGGLSAGHTQEGDNFGIEAKVNYAFDNGAGTSGLLWASYIRQEVDFDVPATTLNQCINTATGATAAAAMGMCGAGLTTFAGDNSGTADAFDVGFKLAYHGFDLVGYYYDGEGIGTTGFLLQGFDSTGDERDSDGWYLQGRYKMPTGTLLGVSYGESNLDDTDYDKARLAAAVTAGTPADYGLLDSNESVVVGLYHPIGEALNLVLEYTETEAEAHNGNKSDEEVLAIGAIMFF